MKKTLIETEELYCNCCRTLRQHYKLNESNHWFDEYVINNYVCSQCGEKRIVIIKKKSNTQTYTMTSNKIG